MSRNTRGNPQEDDKEFNPAEVPRELWAHNKPGEKDYNVDGTLKDLGARRKVPEAQAAAAKPEPEPEKPAASGSFGLSNLWAQRFTDRKQSSSEEEEDSRSEFSSPRVPAGPRYGLKSESDQADDLNLKTSVLNLNLSDQDITMAEEEQKLEITRAE